GVVVPGFLGGLATEVVRARCLAGSLQECATCTTRRDTDRAGVMAVHGLKAVHGAQGEGFGPSLGGDGARLAVAVGVCVPRGVGCPAGEVEGSSDRNGWRPQWV